MFSFIVHWNPGNKFHWNINRISNIFNTPNTPTPPPTPTPHTTPPTPPPPPKKKKKKEKKKKKKNAFENVLCRTSAHVMSMSDYHYGDVIMGALASQITSLMIVYSTVYLGTDQRKHQSSASLAFVRGIHRWPVNSPHKRPVTRNMLPFDDVIINVVIVYSFTSLISGINRLFSLHQVICLSGPTTRMGCVHPTTERFGTGIPTLTTATLQSTVYWWWRHDIETSKLCIICVFFGGGGVGWWVGVGVVVGGAVGVVVVGLWDVGGGGGVVMGKGGGGGVRIGDEEMRASLDHPRKKGPVMRCSDVSFVSLTQL